MKDITLREAAHILGISRQRVHQILRTHWQGKAFKMKYEYMVKPIWLVPSEIVFERKKLMEDKRNG